MVCLLTFIIKLRIWLFKFKKKIDEMFWDEFFRDCPDAVWSDVEMGVGATRKQKLSHDELDKLRWPISFDKLKRAPRDRLYISLCKFYEAQVRLDKLKLVIVIVRKSFRDQRKKPLYSVSCLLRQKSLNLLSLIRALSYGGNKPDKHEK